MPFSRNFAVMTKNLARAVCDDGHIRFEGIVDLDAFLARLGEIPGIEKWTAQYVAMRALGEPDAFPSADLGLLRNSALANARELERRAEAWLRGEPTQPCISGMSLPMHEFAQTKLSLTKPKA